MMPSIDIVYVCLNFSFKGGDYLTRLVEQLMNQTLCLSSTIKCLLKQMFLLLPPRALTQLQSNLSMIEDIFNQSDNITPPHPPVPPKKGH